MSLDVSVGSTAPDLKVSEWVQGDPVQLSDLLGNIVTSRGISGKLSWLLHLWFT